MTDQEMLEALRACDGADTIDNAITFFAEAVGNAEAALASEVLGVLNASCVGCDAESIKQVLRVCGAPALFLRFFGDENQNTFTLDNLTEEIERQAAWAL